MIVEIEKNYCAFFAFSDRPLKYPTIPPPTPHIAPVTPEAALILRRSAQSSQTYKYMKLL